MFYLNVFKGGLFCALLVFSQQARAQCTWLTDFRIDIVPKFPGSVPAYPGCPPLDCDEMMYEVYVRTNGTAFYSEFCYSWLSILGKITVDGRNLDSTSSFVESVRSVTQCSPYNWTAAQLSIEKGGNFAFNIGDPFNPIWPEQLGQCIPLTFGSALLFSVIVHAPLGSTISSINTSTGLNPFVSVYGSNAKFINCKGEMLVTYGGAPNPTVVMPSPAACSSNISYSFNAPALQTFQGNFLDAVQVPILLTGIPTGTLIEEIEALVEVKTTNYMEYGNVQSGIFNCPFLLSPPCDIQLNDYVAGGFRYRQIHAISSNIMYNGDNNLLKLFLLGPLNESIGDCAEIKVKFVRIKIAGNCCKVSPAANQSVQVCYLGSSPCNDFDLTVSELPSTPLTCDVKYRVDLSWSYAQQSFSFENLDFKLRIVSELPFTVIENNTLCTSCITVTSLGGNLYDVDCHLTNATVTKNSAFDLVFNGPEGCVKGYIFLQSTLKTIGSPKCVPELHPAVTLGSYSRCTSRLAGRVEYRLNQLCADILLEAVASDGSPTCHFDDALVDGESPYSFCVCRDKYPYNVTCSRAGNPDNGWLNGVTTYDLVLISKHILGIEPFNDVFKMYAADANCNGSVTTFDIVPLRQLILGIIPTLPGAPNYKFFNAIPPIPNGQGLCNATITSTVPGPSENVNFYVVKTGDVNWNFPTSPNFCFTGGGDDRSRSSIPIRMTSEKVDRGGKVRVPIIFEADASFAAMQFELKFDQNRMQLQNLVLGDVGVVREDNFGLSMASDGLLRFAWFSETGAEIVIKAGTVLCYLEFDAIQDVNEGELSLSGDVESFQTVAYAADGREYDLVQPSRAIARQEMYVQASPNPFGAQTRLMLDLPHDDNVVMNIYNALGALVHTRTLSLSAGQQELFLQSNDVQNIPGVYQVALQSADKSITITIVKQ